MVILKAVVQCCIVYVLKAENIFKLESVTPNFNQVNSVVAILCLIQTQSKICYTPELPF